MLCSSKKSVTGFECTGSDESHIWKKLHGSLLNDFHCGTCQKHANRLFLGLHSLVSLGIGKNLEKENWKNNFLDLVKEVNTVYHTAKQDGRL